MEYESDYFLKGNDLGGYTGYYDFPAHADRVKKIIEIAHPLSLLDVGCAYGYIVRRFLDMGIHAVGIDISKHCEQKASEIIPGNFICHDMRQRLPFRYKEFDVLYCEGTLEHIEEGYIPDIMREFERVSDRRIIQVSFDCHPNVKETEGHLCVKSSEWWLYMLPKKTWLFALPGNISEGSYWYYKG